MARVKVAVVLCCVSISRGVTPQTSWSFLATETSEVTARIGVEGRNLLTLCAVAPLLVSGRIAAALSCRAMLLTAPLMALGMVLGRCVSIGRCG